MLDTRGRILDSASELFSTYGLATSLEQVAEGAGITKGGLLYHFPSKDALVVALARHLCEQLREEVVSRTDPQDQQPGRLARAYIRAHIDPLPYSSVTEDRYVLEVSLSAIPGVRQVWDEDSAWWEAALDADGLDITTRDLVTSAADGVAVARTWHGGLAEDRARSLMHALCRMTWSSSSPHEDEDATSTLKEGTCR